MKYINSYENYNKINECNLLNQVFEKREASTWQKEQKKVIKEVGLTYHFVTTFGTAIPAFYPFIESIIKNTGYEPKVFDIVLLTLTAISILLKENSSRIRNSTFNV